MSRRLSPAAGRSAPGPGDRSTDRDETSINLTALAGGGTVDLRVMAPGQEETAARDLVRLRRALR